MIKQATKKPVTIDFLEWTGKNQVEMGGFIDSQDFHHKDGVLVIHTLEGDHNATIGDMIIKGVHGEFYPCKPDIFAKTYDVDNEREKHLDNGLAGTEGCKEHHGGDK